MSATLKASDFRQGGIGGTDAAAILGLSPWASPLDVWLDKRGERAPKETTEPMLWGTLLEPVIAEEYARRMGVTIWNPETVFHHPEHDVLLASPDRLLVGQRVGLECKTANGFTRHLWGEEMTDQVPPNYLMQCLHYMAVLDYDEWHLAVLIGGSEFRTYCIHRDRELEAKVLPRLLEWWDRHIAQGVRPELGSHESSAKWLQERFPREQRPDLLPADNNAKIWSLLLSDARAQIAEHEAKAEEAMNNLKDLIGEAAGIQGEGWTVTWKAPKPGSKTDWKALATSALALIPKDEAKDLMEQNTTTSEPSRRFVFTEKE